MMPVPLPGLPGQEDGHLPAKAARWLLPGELGTARIVGWMKIATRRQKPGRVVAMGRWRHPAVEGERVGALSLPIVYVGLGDGRVAGGAPDGGRLLPVDEATAVQVDEGPLADTARVLVNRAVAVAPVYGETEPLPEIAVLLLGLFTGCKAEVDESLTTYFRSGHAMRALDQPFGGQAIVVETHRIEDVVAVHPPEAGHEVGLAVGIGVAQMQVARHRRRRRIDGVEGVASVRVELVDALFLPQASSSGSRVLGL